EVELLVAHREPGETGEVGHLLTGDGPRAGGGVGPGRRAHQTLSNSPSARHRLRRQRGPLTAGDATPSLYVGPFRRRAGGTVPRVRPQAPLDCGGAGASSFAHRRINGDRGSAPQGPPSPSRPPEEPCPISCAWWCPTGPERSAPWPPRWARPVATSSRSTS